MARLRNKTSSKCAGSAGTASLPFEAGRPELAGEELTSKALDIMGPAAAEVMGVIASRYQDFTT